MSVNTVHIKYPKVPDVLRLYRSELRVFEKSQENPLLSDLVGAFASDVIEQMEFAVARTESVDREYGAEHCIIGVPHLESFINMVKTLGELLEDREREEKYWARLAVEEIAQGRYPNHQGQKVLESIDDEVADLVRKFRRAAEHSKRHPTYPKTMQALKAIQKKVAYGWR